MSGGTADHDMEVGFPIKKQIIKNYFYQGKLTLIWAYGQEDSFYKPDLLKYHGRKSRGVASIGNSLTDQYKYLRFRLQKFWAQDRPHSCQV